MRRGYNQNVKQTYKLIVDENSKIIVKKCPGKKLKLKRFIGE